MVRLLDLAWHHRLRNDPPDDERYLWIDPTIPTVRLRQVAAMCRKVWRSNEQYIPYAFSQPNDFFDVETGACLLGPTRFGLTCATFVLAIFEVVGLRLVQYETWPTGRDGDVEWQQQIVALLQQLNPPASPEHISAIKQEVGTARFRPEEIAGAATVLPLPASFADASAGAHLVLDKLAEVRL